MVVIFVLVQAVPKILIYVCCWPGAPDFWIVKLDSNFNIEWQKLIGSNVAGDIPANIFCNPDTSYTIFGQVGSNTDDCLCNHSSSQDIWMIIVDEIGNIISQKCFGVMMVLGSLEFLKTVA